MLFQKNRGTIPDKYRNSADRKGAGSYDKGRKKHDSYDAECHCIKLRKYYNVIGFLLIGACLCLYMHSGFFLYAYTALTYAAAMETAKLFDEDNKTISVYKLQNHFSDYIHSQSEKNSDMLKQREYNHTFSEKEIVFYRKNYPDISKLIEDKQRNCNYISTKDIVRIQLNITEYLKVMKYKRKMLQPIINNLREHRNMVFAHSDERFEVSSIDEKIPLMIKDLLPLIQYSLDISNFVITFFTGVTKSERISNIDDIQRLLKNIKDFSYYEYLSQEFILKEQPT